MAHASTPAFASAGRMSRSAKAAHVELCVDTSTTRNASPLRHGKDQSPFAF